MMQTHPIAETDAQMRRPPPPVAWDAVRKIHLMGICGSAMGALAQMLVKKGYEVRGSDRGAYPPMSTTLAAAGITIMEGYNASNLDWGPDVVVVGNVIRPTYDEAIALRHRGVPHCSLPQCITGLFIRDRHSVVVTGTHGKTSTSSMVAWLLHTAGLDPGFMIGGVTRNFGSNHRVSEGGVYVVEGDEYDTAYWDKGPKFLHYRPQSASINNIEFDHADIFADLDAVEATFARFAAIMPSSGRLVVNGRDPVVERVARASAAPLWRFGVDDPSYDVRATGVAADHDGTRFQLHLPGHDPVATGLVGLWGRHNVENALTAAGLALAVGAEPAAIDEGLRTFLLPAKRQELKGVVRDVPVIDDFAHHPTAIAETLASVRVRYPGRRVLALFEVESNTSRRRVFQDGFASALGIADRVWFCRPHAKADNLPADVRLDMDKLLGDIRDSGTPADLIADIDELAQTVASEARSGDDVIIAMSGRDFHGVHDKLLEALDD